MVAQQKHRYSCCKSLVVRVSFNFCYRFHLNYISCTLYNIHSIVTTPDMYNLMKSCFIHSRETIRQKMKELDPEGVRRRQMHRLKQRQYVTKGRLVFSALLKLVLTLQLSFRNSLLISLYHDCAPEKAQIGTIFG